MPHTSSQTFLRELDKKLWTAADKLRSNLDLSRRSAAKPDAAVYKHAVLGLIFLKYVSDSFAQRQADIEAMLKDPENDFFVDPDGYNKPAQYDEAIHRELEERDYYIEKNVFWVPALAIRSDDTLVVRTKKWATGMSPLPNLAGLAPAQPLGDAGLAPAKPLGDAPLIDLIATIPFQHAGRNSSRQSETTPDGGTIGDIMVFGQDQLTWGAHLRRAQRARRVRLLRKQPNQSNPTTWRLAAMNVGMRLARQSATTPGIDFDFGKAPTGPYTRSSTRPLHALIA